MRRVSLNTCLTEQFQELLNPLCLIAHKNISDQPKLAGNSNGNWFCDSKCPGDFPFFVTPSDFATHCMSKGALPGTTPQTMQLNRKSDKMIRFEQDSNSDLCIYWTHAWQSRHISKVPLLCINWSKCARITITHLENKMKNHETTAAN